MSVWILLSSEEVKLDKVSLAGSRSSFLHGSRADSLRVSYDGPDALERC